MMRIFQLKCFHWEGERRSRGKKKKKEEKNIHDSWKLKILLFWMQARNNIFCERKRRNCHANVNGVLKLHRKV